MNNVSNFQEWKPLALEFHTNAKSNSLSILNSVLIYKIFSPTLLILGVIGNILGIYLAFNPNSKKEATSRIMRQSSKNNILDFNNNQNNMCKDGTTRNINVANNIGNIENLSSGTTSFSALDFAHSNYRIKHRSSFAILGYYTKKWAKHISNNICYKQTGKTCDINQHLLRCFYLSNMIYSCSLIVFPIMDIFHPAPITSNMSQEAFHFNQSGNPVENYTNESIRELTNQFHKTNHGNGSDCTLVLKILQKRQSSVWWERLSYNFFGAHLLNPLFKPFLAWSFLIYLFISLNQIMAIWSPVNYKIWLTRYRIRCILICTLLYACIWYAPTFLWLKVERKDRIVMAFRRQHKFSSIALRTGLAATNSTFYPFQHAFSQLCCAHCMEQCQYFYDFKSLYTNLNQMFANEISHNRLNNTNFTLKREPYAATCLLNHIRSINIVEYYFRIISYYEYSIFSPVKYKQLWTQYQLWRELMVKVIPFVTILAVRLLNIRAKRKIDMNHVRFHKFALCDKYSNYSNSQNNATDAKNNQSTMNNSLNKDTKNWRIQRKTSFGPKISPYVRQSTAVYFPTDGQNQVQNQAKLNYQLSLRNTMKKNEPIKTNLLTDIKAKNLSGPKISETLTLNISTISNLTNNSTVKTPSTHEMRREKRKIREYRQHIKTFILLSFEFVCLLLPISVVQMFLDTFLRITTPDIIALMISICLMLEYSYATLHFYLNCIANSKYRWIVIDFLRQTLFCNT